MKYPAGQGMPEEEAREMETAKGWLMRYRTALLDEERLCERIENEQAQLPAAQLESLLHELAAQVENGMRIRVEISEAIEGLQDPQHRLILRYRFLCGCKIRETADRLGITPPYTARAQKLAIAALCRAAKARTKPEDPGKSKVSG